MAGWLFIFFAAVITLSVLGVVLSKQIVRTCVYLLAALLGVAGMYLLLDAEFLAAVQLIIYVGGTLILIVFGVMLTSPNPAYRMQPKAADWWLVAAVTGVMLPALVAAVLSLPAAQQPAQQTPDGQAMRTLGELFVGPYALPFELAAVILLVVMIGAAYLARATRKKPEAVSR